MSRNKTPGRPRAPVPFEDVKGLRTLINENTSQPEMAAYYGVSQSTISRLVNMLKNKDGL